MISLIIPPKDQIARISKMLADEFGTASNIKSRVNRLSVLGAITSVQQRLKLYAKGMCYYLCLFSWLTLITFFDFPVPPNGLVIYCGTIVTEEGKEKKVNIDFEPFKPINTSLYLCDNKVWFWFVIFKVFKDKSWVNSVPYRSLDSIVSWR